MKFTAPTLLTLWETGVEHAIAARPAALLAVVNGESLDDVARLGVGRRDGRLLECFADYGGNRFEAVTDCPQCRSLVELEFDATDVSHPMVDGGPVSYEENGWSLSWRCPDTVDFCHAAQAETVDDASAILLSRCLTVVQGENDQEPPEELVDKLMDLAAAADLQTDVQLAISCPACNTTWQASFDIGAFLWTRIETDALHLLEEVREMAAGYSWSESEILSLSPARRSAYLQLVRGT